MAYRILSPQKFAKDERGDAFSHASAWLSGILADGWEPASEIIASGTTGFVSLLGPQRTNLVFRRVASMETRVSMDEPYAHSPVSPPPKKRTSGK